MKTKKMFKNKKLFWFVITTNSALFVLILIYALNVLDILQQLILLLIIFALLVGNTICAIVEKFYQNSFKKFNDNMTKRIKGKANANLKA